MRVPIRVRPGAARPRVGGDYDGALIVHVTQRAVDGAATQAALAALARSLGVSSRDVELVSGRTARTKIVHIPDESAARYDELRGTGAPR